MSEKENQSQHWEHINVSSGVRLIIRKYSQAKL